jgi:hypothetical protein
MTPGKIDDIDFVPPKSADGVPEMPVQTTEEEENQQGRQPADF